MLRIIGIDEAGRGPLAGPVAVGAVSLPPDFESAQVADAKDSKMMTPRSRERVYKDMCTLRANGLLDFAVACSPAAMIDREGIVPAIHSALIRALESLHLDPLACEIRLDGGLRAPEVYKNQTTIIRGDQTELAISLASIAAKVERDTIMREIALQFPAYGFEIHKGYGTAEHRRRISEIGLSPVHRATFCTRI
jgi:ribonuclease HII